MPRVITQRIKIEAASDYLSINEIVRRLSEAGVYVSFIELTSIYNKTETE